MRRLFVFLLAVAAASAQVYNITTVAGGGPAVGQRATDIATFQPSVAIDSSGKTYVLSNYQVYVFDTSGTLIQIVGNGTYDFRVTADPPRTPSLLHRLVSQSTPMETYTSRMLTIIGFGR